MWQSKEYLLACQALHNAGMAPDLEAGWTVARGFADLGFEVFCLLPNNSLLSLFTGDRSDYSVEQRSHFIWAPTIDQALNEIHKLHCQVLSIQTQSHRAWEVCIEDEKKKDDFSVSANTLEEAVLAALQECYTRHSA